MNKQASTGSIFSNGYPGLTPPLVDLFFITPAQEKEVKRTIHSTARDIVLKVTVDCFMLSIVILSLISAD